MNPAAAAKRDQIIRRRLKAGDTLKEIADRLGRSESTLSRWCSQRGIDLPDGRGRRPDPDLHAAIRQRIAAGRTNPEIASGLGCGAHTVRRIRQQMLDAGAMEASQQSGTYDRGDKYTALAAQIILARAAGKTHPQIAEMVDCHPSYVEKVLKRFRRELATLSKVGFDMQSATQAHNRKVWRVVSPLLTIVELMEAE